VPIQSFFSVFWAVNRGRARGPEYGYRAMRGCIRVDYSGFRLFSRANGGIELGTNG